MAAAATTTTVATEINFNKEVADEAEASTSTAATGRSETAFQQKTKIFGFEVVLLRVCVVW